MRTKNRGDAENTVFPVVRKTEKKNYNYAPHRVKHSRTSVIYFWLIIGDANETKIVIKNAVQLKSGRSIFTSTDWK